MSSLVAGPPEVDIEYPEGPSVPEGDMQVTRRLELLFALRNWYAGRTDFKKAWVCADHNIYYKEGDPRVVVALDVAVAFGLDIAAVKNQRSYRVWKAGAAPCFVLEVASENTVRADLYEKPTKWAELGVREYWRIDPTGGDLLEPPLRGERRHSGRWAPMRVAVDDEGGLRGPQRGAGPRLVLTAAQAAAVGRVGGRPAPRPRRPRRRRRVSTEAEARASAAEAELAELRARLRGTRGPNSWVRSSSATAAS